MKKISFKILFIVLAVVLIGAAGLVIALATRMAEATAPRDIKTAVSESGVQVSPEMTTTDSPISAAELQKLIEDREVRRSFIIPSIDGTRVIEAKTWENIEPENYMELKGRAVSRTNELARALFGCEIADTTVDFKYYTDTSKKRADFVKVATTDDAIVCVLAADTLELIEIDYYFIPVLIPKQVLYLITDKDRQIADKITASFGTNVSDIKLSGGAQYATRTFDLTMGNGKLVKFATFNDELYAIGVYPTEACMEEWAYFVADTRAGSTPAPEPEASATAAPKTYPDKYYGNKIYKGAWLYYLDLRNPVGSPDSEKPLYYIHRVKKDGSGDENLNVLCFRFDFAGEYMYADTNHTLGDFGHWVSYRYDLDGEREKQIEYTNMRRFSKGERLFFTLFNEPAFYSATTACTDVEKYEIKVPDDEEIRERLGYNYEVVFVTVTDEKNGWAYFEFEVRDTGSMPHYTGNYRMNLSSREIRKAGDGVYE